VRAALIEVSPKECHQTTSLAQLGNCLAQTLSSAGLVPMVVAFVYAIDNRKRVLSYSKDESKNVLPPQPWNVKLSTLAVCISDCVNARQAAVVR